MYTLATWEWSPWENHLIGGSNDTSVKVWDDLIRCGKPADLADPEEDEEEEEEDDEEENKEE